MSAATAVANGASGAPDEIAGIRVEAQRGNQTLDASTTDVQGRFTLTFTGGGPVEIVFATDTALLRLTLDALPGTVVTLVVELRLDDEEVVVIDDRIVEVAPVRCEGGRFTIRDDAIDLVIDGRGDDCLRVENDCVVDIAVRSLTLVDCERCIDAQSDAEVRISVAPGGLTCDAAEDGIRAASSALVVIDAIDDIEIVARRGRGIRAESSAQVVLASNGTCLIDAAEGAIRIESSAIVTWTTVPASCSMITMTTGTMTTASTTTMASTTTTNRTRSGRHSGHHRSTQRHADSPERLIRCPAERTLAARAEVAAAG